MTPEKIKEVLMKVTVKRRNQPQREDNEGQRRRDCGPLPLANGTPVHSTGRHTILSTRPQARFPLGLALTATVDPQPLIKIGLHFTLTPSPLSYFPFSLSVLLISSGGDAAMKKRNKIK